MTLPADEAGIEVLFARLPEDVAGEERDWPTDDFDVPGEADAA